MLFCFSGSLCSSSTSSSCSSLVLVPKEKRIEDEDEDDGRGREEVIAAPHLGWFQLAAARTNGASAAMCSCVRTHAPPRHSRPSRCRTRIATENPAGALRA